MPLFSRCGVALLLTALVSGCSIIGPSSPSSSSGRHTPATASECQRDPSRCIYKGRYESGERHYAEVEAKRLNREALDRLRRSGVR